MAVFVPAMLDAFANTSPEPTTTATGHQSDPQRNAPPGVVVAALRWSPKPSAIAIVSVVLSAAVRRVLRGAAARS
jgi:protease I